MVGIRENLVEIAHADQCLVRQTRRKSPVVDQGIVLHVNGRYLVVVRKMRPYRRRLCALAYEPAKRKSIVLIEVVVQLDQPVVAIPSSRLGVKVFVCCCRTIGGGSGPDGAQQGRGNRVLR